MTEGQNKNSGSIARKQKFFLSLAVGYAGAQLPLHLNASVFSTIYLQINQIGLIYGHFTEGKPDVCAASPTATRLPGNWPL